MNGGTSLLESYLKEPTRKSVSGVAQFKQNYENLNSSFEKSKPDSETTQTYASNSGGRRRSWSNESLRKALENIWCKKMTVSVAARHFKIPYTSLSMYANGKYGKTINVAQIKSDCIRRLSEESSSDESVRQSDFSSSPGNLSLSDRNSPIIFHQNLPFVTPFDSRFKM